MTEIDDLELSQRLRALRTPPPSNGFEARLTQRLLEVEPEPAAAVGRAPARVLRGPWRRGPGRLLGATALLVAGAAAALEGGVVEWVQARVLSMPPAEPAPPLNTPRRTASERREAPTPVPKLELPAPTALSTPAAPHAAATAGAASDASDASRAAVPRLHPEHGARSRADGARVAERRPASEPPPAVPRVEIEPRSDARNAGAVPRAERAAAGSAEPLARERGRDLDRIRDIARARREQAGAERPRPLDRLRERRDRAAAERRDGPFERGRGARPNR
jgi:hypothetical protein